ncbi:MAG: potassium channel family protein [Planctomycetota bacterium]
MKPPRKTPRPVPAFAAHGGLCVVLLHVLLSPHTMRDPTSFVAIGTQAGFYLVMGIMLIGVSSHRVELIVCVALVACATAARTLAGPDARGVHAAADIALVLCGGLVLAKAVRRMYSTTRVTTALISVAVATYALSGVVWTIGFHAIETLQPRSFVVAGQPRPVHAGDLSYFSFTTLTTLGYGDIRPASPFARSAATLEAAFGQIFLVVLLGRLVSLHIAGGASKHQGPHEEAADASQHSESSANAEGPAEQNTEARRGSVRRAREHRRCRD